MTLMHLSKWILEGGQAYDRCLSDNTGDSDNSKSFRHHSDITNGRNIDLLGGVSYSNNKWQGGDSDKSFLHQNSLGQLDGEGGWRVHIDMCKMLDKVAGGKGGVVNKWVWISVSKFGIYFTKIVIFGSYVLIMLET